MPIPGGSERPESFPGEQWTPPNEQRRRNLPQVTLPSLVCERHCLATQVKHDGDPLWQCSVRQPEMCSTALRSPWRMRGTTGEYKVWLTIWARGFRRTQSCSSITFRPFTQSLRLAREMLLKHCVVLESPHRMSEEYRPPAFSVGPLCTLCSCEEKPIWLRIKGAKPLPSSKNSSTSMGF